MQVMRVIVKQVVIEWHQHIQSVLPDASLFAAMQLSFDLHFLEASLQPYTTPAGARLLLTCHFLLAQAASHGLCEKDAQCRQVQQAFGEHSSSQSAAAWLSQLSEQAVQQASSQSFFSSKCLAAGAAVGQAAMSVSAANGLSRLASTPSGLAPYSSGIEMPASPRRRLVAKKAMSSVQSRLIGKTASSAAALAALQGKYAVPSTPRSPAIKAFRQTSSQPSSIVPTFPSWCAQDSLASADSHQVESPAAQQSKSKLSKLRTHDSSNSHEFGSDSRTGSILGPKDRHSRHAPPVLQPQSSISLTALAAICKPPPLQIPSQA